MARTDDLLRRLRIVSRYSIGENSTCLEAAILIEALQAERDEAINQLDSARHSVEVLEKRVAEFMADNARLRNSLTGIKRAAAHRMQNDKKDLHSYYFHTADAALNTGKEVSHEFS
jgi:hypothetical protein